MSPYMESNPDGSIKLGFDPNEIEYLFSKIKNWLKESDDLDYRLTTIEKSYEKSNLNWLEIKTNKGKIRVPYEIIFDYRKYPDKYKLSTYKFIEDYSFPNALAEHKAEAIKRFEKKKMLKKKNNPAPRVFKCKVDEAGNPCYFLQDAYYYDQVGTNLSIIFPFKSPIDNSYCVRDWDMAQCGNQNKLPTFEKSKLANTIGIAVGITSKTKDGEQVIIKRLRGENVAVCKNMWSVPFSFALSITDHNQNGFISDLFQFDFGHEFSDELKGLERSDFGEIIPLAFCRDLPRGGKPQFFFKMESKLSYEDLCKKIENSDEFKGKPKIDNKNEEKESPELAAFRLLINVN